MINQESIAAIMGRVTSPTVEVAGIELVLRRPARTEVAEATVHLSRVQEEVQQDEDGGGDNDEIRRSRVEQNMALAERAVMTCVPGIETQDGAFGLIQASGGYVGELSQTCMSLCGMGGGLGPLVERDPTLSSSPESSASA